MKLHTQEYLLRQATPASFLLNYPQRQGFLLLLCVQGVKYGISLRSSGEVMLTLGWPIYWTSFVMAFGCAVSALVVLEHLLHPRKVFMSP